MNRPGPLPAPDASTGSALAKASPLPAWDLSDLYPAIDSPAIQSDLDEAEAEARDFAEIYAGKLADLPGAEIAAAIQRYQALEERLGRVMSFAQLQFSGDGTNAAIGQFLQSCSERVTEISAHMIFFSLELNRLDDAVLEEKLADKALAVWRPFLRDLRVFRPHQLSDEAEKLLHDKDVTGRQAWSRLFDETVAGMRVPFNGAELTVSDVLNKLSDRDRATREQAGRAIGEAFQSRVKLFSLITNTLAKDKAIGDTWRRYPRPESYRNRTNMVEDSVVDALVAAVTADYGRRPNGSAWRSCSIGTAMRRCHPTMTGRSPGMRRGSGCCPPMVRSAPIWPKSGSGSSTSRGSTPGCGRASRAAPSPIRQCRPSIPTCC
jgi:oligoendopeptidase F